MKVTHKKRIKHLRPRATYLLALPSDPSVLASEQPTIYNNWFTPGQEPSENRLDQAFVMSFDASYNCRNGSGTSLVAPQAPASDPMGQLASIVPVLVQGLSQLIGGSALGGSPLANLTFPNRQPQSRSLRALENVPEDEMPLSLQALTRPGSTSSPLALEAGSLSTSTPPPRPANSSELALAASDGVSAVDGVASPSVELPVASDKGNELLDAILRREAKAKEVAAAKKAADKAAKAAEKNVAKAAAPAPAEGEPAAKKPKTKPASEEAAPSHHHHGGKPAMSHEKSRFQFLCRTGVKGEGSQKFRYRRTDGSAAEYANQESAKAAAMKWISERKAKAKA